MSTPRAKLAVSTPVVITLPQSASWEKDASIEDLTQTGWAITT
jgi:hypothetical protein